MWLKISFLCDLWFWLIFFVIYDWFFFVICDWGLISFVVCDHKPYYLQRHMPLISLGAIHICQHVSFNTNKMFVVNGKSS